MMQPYKGYSANVRVDEELGILHGDVIGTVDVVTFQGKTVEDLAKAFHESVDEYLAFCEERGEEPEKPYSGRFVLRVPPELHRSIALAARQADMSMNGWVISVVEHALERGALSQTQPGMRESIPSVAGRRLKELLYTVPVGVGPRAQAGYLRPFYFDYDDAFVVREPSQPSASEMAAVMAAIKELGERVAKGPSEESGAGSKKRL